MTTEGTLEQRYTEVRQRIADAAARSGRSADDVYLIAVTKYAEQDDIRALMDLGHQDFGENRVQQLAQRAVMAQEYLERRRVMSHTRRQRGEAEPMDAVRWHMIGHLQRNKAKKAMEVCRLIHSVDSLRLAEELQQLAMRADTTIEVLLQVNCSEEPQKYGCPLAAAMPLAVARAVSAPSSAAMRVSNISTVGFEKREYWWPGSSPVNRAAACSGPV